jgi:hypothetical protein
MAPEVPSTGGRSKVSRSGVSTQTPGREDRGAGRAAAAPAVSAEAGETPMPSSMADVARTAAAIFPDGMGVPSVAGRNSRQITKTF